VKKHCSQTKYGCCKDSEQLAAQGPNNKYLYAQREANVDKNLMTHCS